MLLQSKPFLLIYFKPFVDISFHIENISNPYTCVGVKASRNQKEIYQEVQ